MKTVCVYHSIDLDGWMSAAIVKHWYLTHVIPNDKSIGDMVLDITIQDYVPKEPIFKDTNNLWFIGYNYGQPIPDLSSFDRVIMCDISFPKEEMSKLWYNLSKKLIWIDHHISAIKDNDDLVFDGIRDAKFAACELTWKYFFSNEEMPEIVRLLGRYDCFGHKTKSFEMSSDGYDKAKQYLKEVGKLKEFEDNKTSTDGYSLVHYANDVAKLLSEEQKVLEFQYGARSCISNYEEAYEYLKWEIRHKDTGNSYIDRIHDNDKNIYAYLCTEAKQAYKNGFEIKFLKYSSLKENSITVVNPKTLKSEIVYNHYHKFICINKERFNPINFGIDYHKDSYDGCACFYYDGVAKLWKFSLYNDNGLVDCSVIAKQFGGGGHKGASGFVMTNEQFKNFINKSQKQ